MPDDNRKIKDTLYSGETVLGEDFEDDEFEAALTHSREAVAEDLQPNLNAGSENQTSALNELMQAEGIKTTDPHASNAPLPDLDAALGASASQNMAEDFVSDPFSENTLESDPWADEGVAEIQTSDPFASVFEEGSDANDAFSQVKPSTGSAGETWGDHEMGKGSAAPSENAIDRGASDGASHRQGDRDPDPAEADDLFGEQAASAVTNDVFDESSTSEQEAAWPTGVGDAFSSGTDDTFGDQVNMGHDDPDVFGEGELVEDVIAPDEDSLFQEDSYDEEEDDELRETGDDDSADGVKNDKKIDGSKIFLIAAAVVAVLVFGTLFMGLFLSDPQPQRQQQSFTASSQSQAPVSGAHNPNSPDDIAMSTPTAPQQQLAAPVPEVPSQEEPGLESTAMMGEPMQSITTVMPDSTMSDRGAKQVDSVDMQSLTDKFSSDIDALEQRLDARSEKRVAEMLENQMEAAIPAITDAVIKELAPRIEAMVDERVKAAKPSTVASAPRYYKRDLIVLGATFGEAVILENGNNQFTLREGEMLRGYGRVTRIDANGCVYTKSGQTVSSRTADCRS